MIDILEIDKIIKNINLPLTLLLSLILNKDNISNENFSIAIRLFIKYHYETMVSYPIILLFSTFKKEIPFEIVKFYKNYFKMTKNIEDIKNLQTKFKKYKNLSIDELEKKIILDKDIFNSYFDATNSNNNFHSKLLQYFCSDDKINVINNEVEQRLKESLKFIGLNFVEYFKIPVITNFEFYNLNGIEKFKFINKYFEMVNKTFQTILFNIKKIEVYKNLLLSLTYTKKINITINNKLDSETENEDLEIFLL